MDAKSKLAFINSVGSGLTTACPNCGAGNSSEARFCAVCGAKLKEELTKEQPATEEQICPNCSTPNALDAKFCGECGCLLHPTEPPAPEMNSTGGTEQDQAREEDPQEQNAQDEAFQQEAELSQPQTSANGLEVDQEEAAVSPKEKAPGDEGPAVQEETSAGNYAFSPAGPAEGETAFPQASKDSPQSDRTEPTFTQPAACTPAFVSVPPVQEETMEATGVFAQGLPDWDLIPPQVVVRRHQK